MPGQFRLLARSRSLALLGQSQLESVAVHADTVLSRQFDGQIDRESVGIVQSKGDLTGQDVGVR